MLIGSVSDKGTLVGVKENPVPVQKDPSDSLFSNTVGVCPVTPTPPEVIVIVIGIVELVEKVCI